MNSFFKLRRKESDTSKIERSKEKDLLKAGELIKGKRQFYGMTRSDLYISTKISVAVLEAIENGWLKQLPEKAYLIKMFKTLEKELNLDKNQLLNLISYKDNEEDSISLKIFTPTNISLFSTWQGSILYLFILLINILLINRCQYNLSNKEATTTQPILINEQILKDVPDKK